MITNTEALAHLLPNVEFTLVDDNYDSIIWENEPAKKPTKDEIEQAKLDLAQERETATALKAEAKAGLLARLGITAEEAELLLS